jgi:hypothetical protein
VRAAVVPDIVFASIETSSDAPVGRLANLSVTRTSIRRGEGAKASRIARMQLFEIWVSVALLGIWSCLGAMYRNSKTSSKQMEEMIRLLKHAANQP